METLKQELKRISATSIYGRVVAVQGLLVSVAGIGESVSIGSRCIIKARNNREVLGEVIGFRDEQTLVMPFFEIDGIGLGCKVLVKNSEPVIFPSEGWLGRVVNGMGEPIDGKGPLPLGSNAYSFRAQPPPAGSRQRLGQRIDLGVKSINSFVTCCRGQRIGIFSGSGIGKSVLLSMVARNTEAKLNIIGLVGERGREVQDFIQDHLGSEGLSRSIVVVSTSDQSALLRRQAAYLTLTLAEFFRDLDHDVLCLMDSITRFAQAQREIGLSGGEPPTSKGYTPTVFSELPKLLERAGPGLNKGSITGLFTVLVEGDDHNEPISDAVRAIVDGHVVLDRSIMERGRLPAVNILKSISRTMPDCNSKEENKLILTAKSIVSLYESMAEMIRLGAYRKGSDNNLDTAIDIYPKIENFLSQEIKEKCNFEDNYSMLSEILSSTNKAQEEDQ